MKSRCFLEVFEEGVVWWAGRKVEGISVSVSAADSGVLKEFVVCFLVCVIVIHLSNGCVRLCAVCVWKKS